ncbi:MAG: ABC transporter substrate-binding protein [Hyphomicrobiales bacterium]
MTRILFALFLSFILTPIALAAEPVETPSLEAAVKAGELPPVSERLPSEPLVVDLKAIGKEVGRHGGRIRTLLGKQKDIRMMTVYGYARLVRYDQDLNLKPDILKAVDVEEGRIFTFHIRPGHKWSDGHPFTSEDFRYWWEDLANNDQLAPGGVPRELLVNGEQPKFEVIDTHTVRYTFSTPNPTFLSAIAAARPLYVYIAAHYMKQFHEKYRPADELAEEVKKYKQRNWASMHRRLGRQYRPENPNLPTLQPWRNSTKPPADQFIFTRNAFFHRVDSKGQQLPYIDDVVIGLGSTSLIPSKTGTGESDLQARYLRFDNYTFLRANAEKYNFKVHLWETAKGAQIALYPNLIAKDETWRNLFRDVRVRRALSLAINRDEINQAVYYGLAKPSNNTVLANSPLFKDEYQTSWIQYDLKLANKLLDEAGLDKRNSDGIRLLPDGRVAEIIVETAGESTEESDVLELIRESWEKAGIKLFTRATQRDVFRKRVRSGDTIMSVFQGLDNAIPTAQMTPKELAPTDMEHLQWAQWGQHYESSGKVGHPPEMDDVKNLLELYKKWFNSTDPNEREQIWHEMLKMHADQMFTIGIVNTTFQPIVATSKLQNLPEKGFFNYNPGAYFGIYNMDTFWLDESKGG